MDIKRDERKQGYLEINRENEGYLEIYRGTSRDIQIICYPPYAPPTTIESV